LFDEVVIDGECRSGEAAGVDLGGAAEEDAVGVEDVDLAVGVEIAEDLGGIGGGVGDLVEGDPLAGVFGRR